ncbi:M23 family metallopeptidase [Gordonia sp. VNK21]|uniref:M23 family metallopeptidase n=1 Tax=Gordonia sp. VNK21 TaxID=3382483 RepID=UPI0038D3E54E
MNRIPLLRGIAAPLIALTVLAVPAGSLPTPLAPGRPGTVAAAPSPAGYDWPLAPRPAVVRPFDPPARRWQAGHRGVDLAAPEDAAVIAARAGTVRFAGSVAGRPLVSVGHSDGLITTYEPVRATVRAGQQVSRGQVLGFLDTGHPGCRAAACLHWGARIGSGKQARYIDPLWLLGLLRIRLKPWE